jgi:hypothetical protein
MAFSNEHHLTHRMRGFMYTAASSHSLSELLPKFLENLGKVYHNRPDLILAAWPEVIGNEIGKMTEALSFVDGILTVRVKNSTLYSLLNQHEKPRIIKTLREKFAGVVIKSIHFRLG